VKQLVQDFKTGEIAVIDVPPPAIARGFLLVRNAFSLVSAGTERATVELAQQSLLGKARSRPDLAKQVFDTLKREGIGATVRKVQSRLDQWKALGYSSAGTVVEIGEGVSGFSVGDGVACAGQDYASHAEIVAVPQNLCAKIPENVEFSHAAFTTLGAIALQSVRQADVRIGETVAVIGLGLVGQLVAQILRNAGCAVLGVDINEAACELAKKCGCDAVAVKNVEEEAARLTDGFGVDAVIITASAETNEPIELAAKISRDRGKIVMVGVTKMEIPREIFYRKELEFRLSRGAGPGRYDPIFEEKGVDYPIGYVRWTEQRNMEAFLRLISCGKINVGPLISHTFSIEDAPKAYELITGKTNERSVGVLIEYPKEEKLAVKVHVLDEAKPTATVNLGVIGAGNYAQGVLLPLFKAQKDVSLRVVCTATGAHAKKAAEKFSFASCTTDWREVVNDDSVNAVLIATRHNLHAEIVCAALRAGKTVFCEKPLCIREEELNEIVKVVGELRNERLMVGFNRRFAPFAEKARKLSPPLVMRYRVSVAPLPREHWVNDPEIGGGRIVGEVCHFVDFLQFAAKSPPASVFARGFGDENAQISVRFADGSVGSIDYFSVADASLAKEFFEAHGGGRSVMADDIREKGQAEEVRRFVEAVKTGGPMPIPLAEIFASTHATFAILKSLQTGAVVSL
jgi:predicted dehydrogenase